MNTVVKIIKIEAFQKEGISLLYGKGPAINGTSITFEVIEGAGMFYAGQNEAAITPGNSYSFWWPLEAAASLYVLQQVANTINYQSVKKTSIWNATSNYGRGSTEEFDNEQDAKEFARNCAPCIQRIDSYTDVICIDTDNIINLTQHNTSAEQSADGVVEPADKSAVQTALTFEELPSLDTIKERAKTLAAIAKDSGCKTAMIGGAPFFMSALETALKKVGVTPVYAFSVRSASEEPDGNGGIRKTSVFKHIGFVQR